MEVSVDAVLSYGPGAGSGGAQQVLIRSQELSACGGALLGGLLVDEGLSLVQALLLLDVSSMSVVLETACGVMTKLIELNTTVSTKNGPVVCDAR